MTNTTIFLRVAQLNPDAVGRPTFELIVVPYEALVAPMGRFSVDVCAVLDVLPEQIDRVLYNGSVRRGDDIRHVSIDAGDLDPEIFVLPAFDGKNSALILGVIGAVIGAYFGGLGGAQAGWALGMGAIQGALTGYAIGTTVGSFLTPRPRMLKDADAISTYQFEGVDNEDDAGVTKPVVLGKRRTGGVRISAFIRRIDDTHEEMHVLLLVAQHKVYAMDDIELNGETLANFPGVTIEKRFGDDPQAPMNGFDVIANTFPQSVDMTALGDGVTYTYRTNRVDIDAFEVLFTLSGLLHTDDKGVRENNTAYSIEYRKVGDVVWTNVDALIGNKTTLTRSTKTTFFVTRRIEGLPTGQYDIRVAWHSIVGTFTDPLKDLWHIFLTGVTEELSEQRTYPGDSLLGLHGIATEQLRGRLPVVTTLCSGYPPPIFNGASFDPADWLGGSAVAPAGRNPAWLVLAVIRNKKWGSGEEFADVDINLQTFLAWANFCKTLKHVVTADGREYDEPLCQLDVTLNSPTNWRDLVMALAQVGRAVIVMSDGVVSAVIDQDVAATQTFTMGNVESASFGLQYQSKLGATNAFDVTIDDADHAYEANTALVASTYQTVTLGRPVRRQSISRIGITRMTQAVRDTRIDLNVIDYVRRVVTFRAFADAILAQVGDCIKLAHDVPQWGYSGRVMPGGDASKVYLDQPIFIDPTQAYELTVTHTADSTEEVHAITTIGLAAGIYNTVTVAPAFASAPQEGDLYSFGRANISTKKFRIIQISLADDSHRRIEAIESIAGIYADDGVIDLTPASDLPNINALPGPITQLDITESIELHRDDTFVSTFILQWPRPAAGRAYGAYLGAKIQRSWNYVPIDPASATWEDWDYVEGTEKRWVDVPHGVLIAFKVIPQSLKGYNLAGSAVNYLTASGYSTAPPAVFNFRASVKDNTFVWEWDEYAQAMQYELRNTNSGWGDNDATKLVYRGRAQKFTIDTPSARAVTLFAKIIDANHNFSVGAVSVTATDAQPLAPTISSITRFKNTLKITVTPNGSTADYVATYLHASQTPGFTPSTANRVAGVVSGKGGEFVFATTTAGLWYFRAASSDWLTGILDDYVYSAESSAQLIIIAPVDPSAVVLTVPDSDDAAIIEDPFTQRPRPVRSKSPTITWTHTDAVNPSNSLIGFELYVYDSTGSIAHPILDVTITSPAQRSFRIDNVNVLNVPTIIAAVKAIYVDGLTSNIVNSLSQTIQVVTNPTLRDSDDRYTAYYAESFDDPALPTGITVGGATYAISGGVLTITSTGVGSPNIFWDVDAWASAYLDVKRTGVAPRIAARLKFLDSPLPAVDNDFAHPTGTWATLKGGSGGIDITSAFLPIDDGTYHTYLSPPNQADITGSPYIATLTFSTALLPVGKRVAITALAVYFESVDLQLDGWMDRAQNARKQFGRDPVGAGFFSLVASRLTDSLGNIVITSSNGGYIVSGAGITDMAYRRAVRCLMRNATNTQRFTWGSTTGIDPAITLPAATNKFKAALGFLSAPILSVAPAAGDYPLRVVYLLTEIDESGFTLTYFRVGGGTPKMVKQTAPAGAGWTATAGRSSLMTLGTAASNANTGGDAWYHPVTQGDLVGTDFPFLEAIWLAVDAPLQKKPDGNFYWMKCWFRIYLGSPGAVATANPLTFASVLSTRDVTIRVLTDGQRWRVPFLHSSQNGGGEVFKVDFFQCDIETGLAGGTVPTRCVIDSFEAMSYSAYTSAAGMASGDVDVIALEEY